MVLNTQTPLVRLRDDLHGDPNGEAIDLGALRQPDDFKFTTGGVTRMVFPLLRGWLASEQLVAAEWVAMATTTEAPRLRYDGVDLSFVALDADARAGYAVVKEQLWALLNSNPGEAAPRRVSDVPESAWAAFDDYQSASARALEQAAARMGGVDLLYVHDFQQLGVAGAWRGRDVRKVFHLHTPFPTGLPDDWVAYVVDRMHDYDAVVVSTERYARNLRVAGLDAPIHVVYPFIDPDAYRDPTREEIASLRQRFGIAESDRVILNVGRMDPVKAQDRLILAMPRILAEEPNARLVLVGNGSFSSSRKGGLGLGKGARWRAELEALAQKLGVAERVTFTGHLDDALLPAAYGACDVFCLPSTREGFGLAVIEAWRHAKPVVVCDRAGASELIVEGENGRVVDCRDVDALADALLENLLRPELARARGEAGFVTSEKATLPTGRRALESIFGSLLDEREAEAPEEAAAHARA